jgi:hypothetical protein
LFEQGHAEFLLVVQCCVKARPRRARTAYG